MGLYSGGRYLWPLFSYFSASLYSIGYHCPFLHCIYPQITNITGITATLEVQTNEDGRTYWVILPEGATAPSIAQVLSGSDADDAPVSSSGNRGLTANDLEQVVTNSYTSETSYIAYIVSCDNNSNYIETTSPTAILFSTADVTPPSAIFDPVNASVDIALDKTITITFTEAIYNTTDELITNSNISSIISFTESNSGGTPVAATISYDEINYVITIDPTDNLKELQLYNIELSDLQDADGNLRSTSNTTFTTEDTTPPTTTFVDPQNDDTNVSIGAPLEISFNESVRKLDNTPISNTDLESIITFSPAATFTATINASNDGILIYPYPYLSSETEYTITIDPVEDYSGNEQIASSSITFTTAKFNIWNGNAGDNDFSNSANYEIGYTYGAGVLVAANEPLMIISDDANIPHLIIEPLAKVTIASGTTVTLSDELTIISDASGSGSLIIDGTLSVSSSKINIQQNITDASQYEFVSPPVQGATHASIGADGAIYSWNNQTGNWDSQTTDASLNPMSGYILKSSNDLLYNGALNRGSFSIDAKGTPKNSGFTLAGNPYTASIDWDLIASEDKFNIKDKFWIYKDGIYANHDVSTGIDTDLEGDASLIPSGHAFWIQANWSEGETVTGTLSVNETYLAHNETSYLKSGSSANEAIPHIKLAGIHNGVQCEKAIGFTPNASEFYDDYDTPRFFGFSPDAIELYSIVEDKKLAINSYPELINNMVIPLGYKTRSSGTFTIRINNMTKMEDGLQVLLTDHLENTVIDLNSEGSYEFTSEATSSDDRFSIQLIGDVSTDVDTPATDDKSINIYSIESTLYIKVDNIKNPEYTLYNIDGKLIDMDRLNPQSLNHIEMNGQKGIFIVKVIGDGFVTSKKVVIN
ncbi:Ig-like domain-containing protein [Saccharicrinis fermentans]|uniref:Ig-like domain-containing protein n=1 Tax=Saccharicrinis fermentans TaxID=982 RepID=UPI0005C6FF85|nr:Ig-like domain-containing protein [Saccharicrinis fermentans]